MDLTVPSESSCYPMPYAIRHGANEGKHIGA